MVIWDQYVDLLRAAIFGVSQVFGGNVAMGIIAVTLLLRIAMLPLTLRLARLSAAHQAMMRKLKPQLDQIRKRCRKKPERLAEETRRLFAKEGVSPYPVSGCVGTAVQLPIWLGLFSAVRRCVVAGGRFLWIRNIANPDFFVAVTVAGLTYATVALSANSSEPSKTLSVVIPTVITFVVLLKLSAGIGLYWATSSAVGMFQTWIVRRETLRAAKTS